MQKEMLNNGKSGLEQDNNRTTIRVGGLEISMTEEKRGALIEKLSKWRDEATKLFICCLIAGLLSLIPFENVGKAIVTKGQEWVQDIQIEMQLRQERIEKKKAEKAIREAEKAAEKAKETEEISTEEIVNEAAKHLKGMIRILGVIMMFISIISIAFSLCANNSDSFAEAVAFFTIGTIISLVGVLLPYK